MSVSPCERSLPFVIYREVILNGLNVLVKKLFTTALAALGDARAGDGQKRKSASDC